jgi:uncharacterized membrane protein
MEKKLVSGTFAAAAAALFAAACGGSTPAPADASSESASAAVVKCLGAHDCKGQSQCGVEGGHACAGQNECKGKGWVKLSPEECTSKGGQVL